MVLRPVYLDSYGLVDSYWTLTASGTSTRPLSASGMGDNAPLYLLAHCQRISKPSLRESLSTSAPSSVTLNSIIVERNRIVY